MNIETLAEQRLWQLHAARRDYLRGGNAVMAAAVDAAIELRIHRIATGAV